MALLHSLVDNLQMKNSCHQKEGVTLRHCYLTCQMPTLQCPHPPWPQSPHLGREGHPFLTLHPCLLWILHRHVSLTPNIAMRVILGVPQLGEFRSKFNGQSPLTIASYHMHSVDQIHLVPSAI
jgi:hypothetical protein